MHPLPRSLRLALAGTATLWLAACAGVPDRVAPPRLPDHVALAAPTATAADWPAADWWARYDDPQLAVLMQLATRHAPGLALARSRFDGAAAAARLAAAQLGFTLNGSAQIARQRMSDNGLIPSQFLGFNWYNQGDLGIRLDYDFDWWGRKRADMEAALGQARAAEAEQAAATLALRIAVADTYFGWQAEQARLALAREQLTALDRLAEVATLRVRQGVDLPDTAQTAQARQAAAREQVIALEGTAAVRRVTLAALVGVTPADLPELQPRPLPAPGAGLPATAGIDLIARRPDIAASRWQVEAALRQTDAARAAFFPDLSLSAMAGLSSIDIGKLFSAGSRSFALAPALHLPIFNHGALKANHGVSRARLEAAVAQYDASVLDAAREVATQALLVDQLAARRHEQQRRLEANRHLLAAAEARARQGVRDIRESLAARLALLDEEQSSIALAAQAVSTELALTQALGGGYHAALPSSGTVIPGASRDEQH